MTNRDARCFLFAVFLFCCCAFPALCRAGERRHDPLPLRYAELNRYDAIALEPYRDTYDRLPVHEKARVYAQAFEFMNSRTPNFSPETLERIRRSEEIANARSAYDKQKFMYNPPPDPREREMERERRRRLPPGVDPEMLSGIPMPWQSGGGEGDVSAEGEGGADASGPDEYRMEAMRPGSLRVNRAER